MTLRLVDPAWLPDLSKAQAAHKYEHGHALVLAGGVGKGGAARLAARAALRVGTGAVTLLCPSEALAENAVRLDAIMLAGCPTPADLRSRMSDRRVTALCLGPSLGLDAEHAELVAVALESVDKVNVALDADALTLLGRSEQLRQGLHARCVLTPHAGEFARLVPDLAKKLEAPARHGPAYSKLDATRDAAERLGCTILFKGPDSVIATPDGQTAIHAACHERSAPWLATAGSGDVLAGMICGFLARGLSPFHAACWGAWLHVACATAFGPGLIAEDLSEQVPKVLRGLTDRA